MNEDWLTPEEQKQMLEKANWKAISRVKWNSFLFCVAAALVGGLVVTATQWPDVEWKSPFHVVANMSLFAYWRALAYQGEWTRPPMHNVLVCWALALLAQITSMLSAIGKGSGSSSWVGVIIVVVLLLAVNFAVKDLAMSTLLERDRPPKELQKN